MIYRHNTAPPRAFSQFSHDLIRHPRLSSDAVRLLTWQLSLPGGAREPLSRTAERARIGACAFTRAKRQLKEEGFVHERRLQGPGGHWVTQQLVSNVPLSAAEAAKILARMPVHVPDASASPQPVPSARVPTAGAPTPPPTDGHPKKNPGGNTSHPPAEPDATAPEAAEIPETARALVAALPRLSPDLRRIPLGMHDELARLVTHWLAAGHAPTAIRAHILRGLPSDGTPVHRPGGLLRYLLRDIPPAPVPDATPAAEHPAPARPSNRLAALRECEGDHVQATLFRPTGDETLCRRCLTSPPSSAEEQDRPEGARSGVTVRGDAAGPLLPGQRHGGAPTDMTGLTETMRPPQKQRPA
ncbi:hypothetical protein ACH4VX_09890 [Streptomyces sp. NPDC020731]|uniref:hypothetical protein n=1 Tax=Streptomyces sp. NPDC020731 TaxID=3365085 RepID=UPI00378A9CCB